MIFYLFDGDFIYETSSETLNIQACKEQWLKNMPKEC